MKAAEAKSCEKPPTLKATAGPTRRVSLEQVLERQRLARQQLHNAITERSLSARRVRGERNGVPVTWREKAGFGFQGPNRRKVGGFWRFKLPNASLAWCRRSASANAQKPPPLAWERGGTTTSEFGFWVALWRRAAVWRQSHTCGHRDAGRHCSDVLSEPTERRMGDGQIGASVANGPRRLFVGAFVRFLRSSTSRGACAALNL